MQMVMKTDNAIIKVE